MIKHILLITLGSAFLLVSCEPIFIQPTPGPKAEEPTPPGPTLDEYPVAEKTVNPNYVISPHAPYNVINIQDFRPGQLAMDPSTNQIFRVP
ncbi:MAG: hypothetical protein RL346_1650 [Verrucomicrobiota bacterium]|jgi:hypothetical protein